MKTAEEIMKLAEQFEEVYQISEGLIRVKQNGLYGYVNADYNWVIRPQYVDARDFKGGVAFVEEKSPLFDDTTYTCFVDKTGREKKRVEDLDRYDKSMSYIGHIFGRHVFSFGYGVFIAYDNDFSEYSILKGYKSYNELRHSYGPGFNSAFWDYKNKSAVHGNNSEGLTFIVKSNHKGVYIDEKGREVIKLHEKNESSIEVAASGKFDFHGGLAVKEIYKKQRGLGPSPTRYGYIDYKGKEVIPAIYEDATPFKGELATVKYNGKELLIDKEGHTYSGSLDKKLISILANIITAAKEEWKEKISEAKTQEEVDKLYQEALSDIDNLRTEAKKLYQEMKEIYLKREEDRKREQARREAEAKRRQELAEEKKRQTEKLNANKSSTISDIDTF